jgi:hypothetical protein
LLSLQIIKHGKKTLNLKVKFVNKLPTNVNSKIITPNFHFENLESCIQYCQMPLKNCALLKENVLNLVNKKSQTA